MLTKAFHNPPSSVKNSTPPLGRESLEHRQCSFSHRLTSSLLSSPPLTPTPTASLIPQPFQCPLEPPFHGEQSPFNCSLGAGSLPFSFCFLWTPSSPPTPLLSDSQSLERENLRPPYPSKTLLLFYLHVNSSFSSYAPWVPTATCGPPTGILLAYHFLFCPRVCHQLRHFNICVDNDNWSPLPIIPSLPWSQSDFESTSIEAFSIFILLSGHSLLS